MKIIGLTGGIGSGKTTVARMFEELGIPVYIADTEAKALMNRSKIIQRKLIQLLGKSAYIDGKINRAFLAEKIFNDSELRQKVNSIVHPKVATHFERWVKKQQAPYCLKEAAILFETGGDKNCDATILVVAPIAIRLERVLSRDKTTESAVRARMESQWSDEKKMALADYVIENIDLKNVKMQVEKIHRSLIRKVMI